MKPGYGPMSLGPSEPATPDEGLPNRHVTNLSDEIGDRVLILDERGKPSLELLRFAPTLTRTAGFEVALRRRVERLRQFRHPAFPVTPAVEYLGEDRTLVLLSSYTPERRLSEVIEHAHGTAFASSLIRQLTPALATLHRYGDGIGHGALTASRIVISNEGQLIIIEHVLGPALERLQLTGPRMHAELGIPVPLTDGTAGVRMDGRTDFFQLGLIALALLLGRPLTSVEYPEHLGRTLDHALSASDPTSGVLLSSLRDWLERALQLNGRAFPSYEDANDAARDIREHDPAESAQRWQQLLTIPRVQPVVPIAQSEASLPTSLQPIPDSSAIVPPTPVEPIVEPIVRPIVESIVEPIEEVVEPIEEVRERRWEEPRPLWSGSHANVQPLRASKRASRPSVGKWTVVALASCAIVEALIIGLLVRQRWNAPAPVKIAEVQLDTPDPGAAVMVDGRSAGVTPLQLKISPDMRSISVVSSRPAAAKQEAIVGSTGQQNVLLGTGSEQAAGPAAGPGKAAVAGPAPQRFGGIRLSSPIELEVFEGDRRLGSSATGVVSAPAGRRELDLVNSVLGFRSRRIVDVESGQVVTITVSPPNGRININALPWAEVLIDGKSVGETPIGNLSIPLGEHEVLFRHPQLGEVRRTALVRSDTVTRVSANLER